jgi:hypothetical protein
MSDLGGVPGQEAYRIGDAERSAAIDALNSHREAGQLDATEFEDRQVRVSRARTWAEIQPLFTDLPGPHPAGMPVPGVPLPEVVPPAGHSGTPGGLPVAQPVPAQGPLAGLVPERYRTTVMALTPFAALLLFFGTHWWEWFLAIPIMGILLYGPDGSEERKRQKRERRRAARDRRR